MTTFQRETVRKGLKLYGRVLINDDSGIGKSLEGLGLALAYRHEWPLLIVCPNFCKYHWRHEVLKWLPGFELKRIQVLVNEREEISSDASVLIVTFDIAYKMLPKLANL